MFQVPPWRFASLLQLSFGEALVGPLSECLFECLEKHFGDLEFDCLVPVPSHPGRIRSRGFDAVGLISRRFSRKFQVPIANALGEGSVHPAAVWFEPVGQGPQPEESFQMNSGNKLPPGNLLVIDNVLTTGTTLSEVASVIAAQEGGRNRFALTVARTPLLGTRGSG